LFQLSFSHIPKLSSLCLETPFFCNCHDDLRPDRIKADVELEAADYQEQRQLRLHTTDQAQKDARDLRKLAAEAMYSLLLMSDQASTAQLRISNDAA
jgi:hypothetical protein